MGSRRSRVWWVCVSLLWPATAPWASQANVYSVDPLLTPNIQAVELLGLDALDPQTLSGYGAGLLVYHYQAGSPETAGLVVSTISSTGGDDFLYVPAAHDASFDGFAGAMAYHHMGQAREFFVNAFGLDFLPWPLAVVVNARIDGTAFDRILYSQTPNGAEWQQAIFVGQAEMLDLAYDGTLLTRAFAQHAVRELAGFGNGRFVVTPYGHAPFAGAIEDGAANYLAGSIHGMPTIGEYGLAADAVQLDVPGRSCPELQGDRDDASMVANFAWSVRQATDAVASDALLWNTLEALPVDPSLPDFANAYAASAQASFDAAELTSPQLATIQSLLAASGMAACPRLVQATRTAETVRRIAGLDALASERFGADCASLRSNGARMPMPFQFAVAAAAADQSVSLGLTVGDQASGPGQWQAYVRAAEPVTFGGTSDALTALQFDASIQATFGATANVTLDGTSTPALVPGVTYYVAITHSGCPAVQASIEVDATMQFQVFADGFEEDG